jgi:GH18 family chitinase
MPHRKTLLTRDSRHLLLAMCFVVGSDAACAVEMVGYVPYYRMNGTYNANTLPAQLAMLDEVRYFGLTAASNGTIATLDGASISSHTNRIQIIKNAIAALPAEDCPRLDITLGGAGQAASFATIAASASLRSTFAQNIDALLDSTGATSVDIDWEHPTVGIERTTYYPAMLKQIKQAVGTDRRVNATVAPSVMISNSVFDAPNAVDGVSLMTYDLGWWGNDPSNPNQGEHSLPEYVADAVEAWTEPPGSHNDRPWVFGTWGNNAPADKLGVGLPFYAHTVTSPDATYTYSELAAGGSTADGNYYTYQGRTAWLPGPDLVAERIQYAYDHNLQHIIIWELGQDLSPSNPDSLLRAAYDTLQSLVGIEGDYNGDNAVDAADYALWRSDPASYGGAQGYIEWRNNFGTMAPSSGSVAGMVPEPGAAGLFLLIGLVLATRCRTNCPSSVIVAG